jgi:hypothetical protein
VLRSYMDGLQTPLGMEAVQNKRVIVKLKEFKFVAYLCVINY